MALREGHGKLMRLSIAIFFLLLQCVCMRVYHRAGARNQGIGKTAGGRGDGEGGHEGHAQLG